MATKILPPKETLLQLLRYDPETGKLFWRKRPIEWFADGKQSATWNAHIWNGKNAGTEALATATPTGHKYGSIDKVKMYAHRVIWKMIHDEDAADIDHINGNPADNRLENLRNVPHIDNGRNMKRRKNNTSGHNGIYWSKPHGKWCASINVDYRKKHIGLFDSLEDAIEARKAAEAKHGFHTNHGRE